MNQLMRIIFLSVFLSSLVSFSIGSQAADIIISNARIHTMSANSVIEGSILIRGGQIAYIGSNKDVPATDAEVQIVDAENRIVTPGFIDSSSIIGLQEVGRGTRAEDSQYRGDNMSAAFMPVLAFNPYSTLIRSLTVEGLTHAFLQPEAGNDVFAGQGVMVNLGQQSESMYGNSAALYVYLGEAGRRIAGDSRAAALQRLMMGLEEAKLMSKNRRAYESGRLRDLSFGAADLSVLAEVVEGKKKLVVYVDRAAEIETVLRELDPYKLDLVLAGAREAWKVTNAITSRQVPVLINVLDNRPSSFDRLGARLDHAALLSKAGVRFAFMSEDQFTETRVMTQAGGVAVAHGLPWIEALRALTQYPAEIWGMESQLGTLEPGKEASLVIWSGDPLEISEYAAEVMVKGKWLGADNRQKMLRDRYRHIDDKVEPYGYR